jgi:RimJ/RimL family protein N-acetyltransferase
VHEGDEVRIGLGIRPDLTGRGLAQPFIQVGLRYAAEEWRPKRFRLWVAWWNERALRAYRRAGFRAVAEHEGRSRFVEMERPA